MEARQGSEKAFNRRGQKSSMGIKTLGNLMVIAGYLMGISVPMILTGFRRFDLSYGGVLSQLSPETVAVIYGVLLIALIISIAGALITKKG